MGNRDMRFLLMVFSLTSIVAVLAQSPLAKETTPVSLGKEKVTHLHFYFHDTLGGKNATAVIVAQAATTNQSPTSFGMLCMLDDPLTEGPEPTSKLMGRAQGVCGSAGQKEYTLIMALSFVFTEGKFNGSTLSVLTRNQILNPIREFPIVGGTGVFRFARGFMMAKTYWFNTTTGDAIVEYNVTVIHYCSVQIGKFLKCLWI